MTPLSDFNTAQGVASAAVSSDRLHPATLLVQAEAEYAYYEAGTRPNEANENQQDSACGLNSKQN